jgi:UDP-N-acetylglucosamine 3-dehydrogenase
MINVAILGAGFMGAAHATNYRALEGSVRVKTVASRTLERAGRIAETVGAEATTDLDAAIRDPEVDAVDICLPTPLHRDAAERAFAAGKHVFLEKPIALTPEDADTIIRAAEQSGRLFMVGLVLRCSDWSRQASWGSRSPSTRTACPRPRTGTTGWRTPRSRAGSPSTWRSTTSTS